MTDPFPKAVEGATPGHLLALIRSRPAWTRQQLLDATGMSRPTLTDRLAPLFAHELIHAAGVRASVGGRPADLIRFDDRHMVVLTLAAGHTRVRAAICDVAGNELRHATARLQISTTPPARAVSRLISLARPLVDAGAGERLIGIGVGLPGPISPTKGLTGAVTTMPGWDTYPFLDRLREQWDVPYVLENDARALVIGEATRHPDSTVLGVKWSTGIGAGLVTGGVSLSGDDGDAGDIGHVKVSTTGPTCRCGRVGCLAAHAAGFALLPQLGLTDLDQLRERALAGDPQVTAALQAASRRMGSVLAALIALTNPRILVLGGVIGSLPVVVRAVGDRIRDVTLQRSTDSLQVLPSALGDRAGTVGLVHLVLELVLSPAAIDQTIAAAPATT